MADTERRDTSPGNSSLDSPESDGGYKSCQYLTVDETKRPRANSDPVGLHFAIANLPQITVTEEDDPDGASKEDGEVGSYLGLPATRPRSNTCPEDLFKLRRGRPPTPPPTDVVRSPGGKKRIFNFNVKELNGISFAHHRLCKVSEDGGELVTKSNQHIRPSHGARRASCLAALSETSTIAEEQKEKESRSVDVPNATRSTLPGNSESSVNSNKAKSAFHTVDRALDQDFQRISINPSKSNIRSDGVDLGMSIALRTS